MRNKAPNKGQPPVTLHHADVVNLVDVREKSYENCVKEFVLGQGIDFIFDPFSRMLKICVRYAKLAAQMQIVMTTLLLNLNEISQVRPQVNHVSLWVQQVRPVTYFERDGVMLEVVRVEGENAVVIEEDSDVELVININKAAELLRDYIC